MGMWANVRKYHVEATFKESKQHKTISINLELNSPDNSRCQISLRTKTSCNRKNGKSPTGLKIIVWNLFILSGSHATLIVINVSANLSVHSTYFRDISLGKTTNKRKNI